MSRVEAAVQEGRCVLAIGGRALQDAEVIAELRRRNVPAVALGGDPVNPAVAITAEALLPVTSSEGALLVLVEPDATTDGKGLNALAELLAKAKHKPRVHVAAKAFNPFGLPMALRLMKLEQVKARAKDFLASLPIAAAAPVATPVHAHGGHAPAAPAVDADKTGGKQAPRPLFIGREEELPALVELLGAEGGPIIVTGPPGVGRRWLVEQAIASAALKRLPDFTFGRGVGADAFLGRIAVMAQDAGDDTLAGALKNPESRPLPVELAGIAAKALQNPALAGKVWVVFDLHRELDRRDGSLHRMGRLELTLKEILTSTSALRVVFVTNQAPTFYREGEAANLRHFKVAGLKGRELHQLFAAWHVENTPRDRFGPIVERTFGHPMLTRAFALEVAEGADLDELLKSPRHLKAENAEDLDPLRRHLKRRVEELDEPTRKALALCAHLREPGTAAELQLLGIGRNERINLLARGLLEQTPGADDRRFYVHPLIREQLDFQETSRFDVMEALAIHYAGLSSNKARSRAERLSWAQEAHRLFIEARSRGAREVSLPFADQDAVLESVHSLMRRKEPRLDIARARINEALRFDPKNTELLIADAELKAFEKGSPDAIAAAWARAAEVAPTPEVFHQEASYYLDKNQRGKAVTALEKAVALYPFDARLHRRLANLYLRQNRADDAVTTLRRAMELEPMMPDAYSVMGELLTAKGPAHWEEAAQFIEEALRLDPDSPGHVMRQAALLRYRGMMDAENRAALWADAIDKLKAVIPRDPNGARIHALLGSLIIDSEGDLDQAEWLVKKALKLLETSETLVQRARVLVRRAAFADAEQLLNQAIKKEPGYHPAFAALGELMAAQGQIFMAFEHWKKARERSPKDAPERALYDVQLNQLGALIESGAVPEIMRAVESGAEQTATEGGEVGLRREAGNTAMVRKRRRGRRGGHGHGDASQEAGSDAGSEAGSEAGTEAGSDGESSAQDAPEHTEEVALREDAAQVPSDASPTEESPEAPAQADTEQAASDA